jgi:N-acetyl-anhydromuramyl-L-alanine amidase AmpD
MYGVLRSLGLSAHLLVDGDATVYQLMDLTQTKAFDAG